jgi:hypothetical protein
MQYTIAPIRNVSTTQAPWEGNCVKKPWDYKVTAAIPVIGTFDILKICVESLRCQTERPFIMVIDTGSTPEELKEIESLRAEDLEVHSIRLNGVEHPSDFPAMAMDLAFTLCRTQFMFATHADCFLRRKEFIAELLELTIKNSPVVGYELSPRAHADWVGMVSHTATMFHIPSMDKIGFGWSLRRLANIYNIKNYKPNPMTPNWPDTEILGNYILRKYKINPLLIGKEENFVRNKDDNIDHCRSITSGKLYSPEYYEKATKWAEDAKKEALQRIDNWKKEGKNEA